MSDPKAVNSELSILARMTTRDVTPVADAPLDVFAGAAGGHDASGRQGLRAVVDGAKCERGTPDTG